jgi:hypothetical protein
MEFIQKRMIKMMSDQFVNRLDTDWSIDDVKFSEHRDNALFVRFRVKRGFFNEKTWRCEKPEYNELLTAEEFVNCLNFERITDRIKFITKYLDSVKSTYRYVGTKYKKDDVMLSWTVLVSD